MFWAAPALTSSLPGKIPPPLSADVFHLCLRSLRAMHSLFLDACSDLFLHRLLFPGPRLSRRCRNPLPLRRPDDARELSISLDVSCDARRSRNGRGELFGGRKKENVWSIDNDLASARASEEKTRKYRKRRGRKVRSSGRRRSSDKVMVSGSMLMEVETVLQTQVRENKLWLFRFRISLKCNFDKFLVPFANKL